MCRGVAPGIVALALALPASAAGTVLCVPSTSIPGCPTADSESEATLQDATTNGMSGDEILIGANTFDGPLNDGGKSFTILGAGEGQTVVQGQGVAAMSLSSGSTVSNLTVNLANGAGSLGIALAGTANHVAVTATEPNSTMNNIGVALAGGGTFSHGSITLPLTGGDAFGYAGVVGDGTVSDSTITAAVGVASDISFNMPNVHRDLITANQGIVVGGADTIDDSLIKTVAEPPAQELGIGLDASLMFGNYTARHVTVVGDGTSGSVGISAQADSLVGDATSVATLSSSIVTGYATSISASATAPFHTAVTTIAVNHSIYDPSKTKITQAPPQATATISADASSGNRDPLFVNPAGGDFRLQAGSPAIDSGDPAPLAAGESTTDLAGNPRAVAGRKSDAAISDIGAYEFQPHPPTVSAHASGTSTFIASGSDPSPGDSVSFGWVFDDGATATGATVTHRFTKPGRHNATVTATDLDGFTATAQVTVATLGKPAITHLKVRRGVVSYRDSQASTTTFTLKLRRRVIARFTHRDRAGVNRFKLKRRLRAGHYMLVAVPRGAVGRGRAVSTRFTVRR